MSLRKPFRRKHNRINNNKVKLHHLLLITSSHKQFNYQYNKHHTLRSSHTSCSSLRLGILPLSKPEIHTQSASHDHLPRPRILPSPKSGSHNEPASCELPRLFTNISHQEHITTRPNMGLSPRLDLRFIFNQCHASYLGFPPVSCNRSLLFLLQTIMANRRVSLLACSPYIQSHQ